MTIEGKSDGEIIVNDLLQIKSTGSVSGKVIYGKIQVEDGGKIIGEINYRDKEHKQEEFKDIDNYILVIAPEAGTEPVKKLWAEYFGFGYRF